MSFDFMAWDEEMRELNHKQMELIIELDLVNADIAKKLKEHNKAIEEKNSGQL